MVASSADDTSPLIVVFGSTGTQGASVIDHLVSSDKSYRIKGVTRDTTKPAAKALGERGIEAVQAKLDDLSSIEAAIQGADYIFGVTNFWETGEGELQQGKNIVDAIASVAPQAVFLWSGVDAASKISGGKYKGVRHFDLKAEITDCARSKNLKIVVIQPGSYCENFFTNMAPRKQDDGSYVLGLPMRATDTIPMLHTRRDYGAFVVAALESGMKEGNVYAATAEPSAQEIVDLFSNETGKKVVFYPVPAEQFKAMAGEELTEMFQFIGEFGYFGHVDLAPSQAMVKGTQSFEGFVKEADWSRVFV